MHLQNWLVDDSEKYIGIVVRTHWMFDWRTEKPWLPPVYSSNAGLARLRSCVLYPCKSMVLQQVRERNETKTGLLALVIRVVTSKHPNGAWLANKLKSSHITFQNQEERTFIARLEENLSSGDYIPYRDNYPWPLLVATLPAQQYKGKKKKNDQLLKLQPI